MRTARAVAASLGTLLGVAALGACTGSPDAIPTTTTTTTATATEAPVWDDQKRSAARTAGVQGLELYLGPGVSRAEWWADLEPVLSERGVDLYEDSVPPSVSRAPVTITGQEARLIEGKDGTAADVHVRTSRGVYVVSLSRGHVKETWKIDAFHRQPPNQSA